MTRKVFQILFLATVVLLGLVAIEMPSVSEEKESPFKNVQILKDMTPDELDEYMIEMLDHLGVKKCTYCHVRDKSSDENEHKVIARKYIKMTKELNETIFKDTEEKITCYTCHRGKKHPVNHPEDEEKEE